MTSEGADFRRLNVEVQEKLDCALSKFQEMKKERDNALRLLQRYEKTRSRSLEGITERLEDEEEEEEEEEQEERPNHKQPSNNGNHRSHHHHDHHHHHHRQQQCQGDGDDDDGGEDDDGEEEDEYVWEIFNVVLNQANADQGFGLSIRGGRDDPYFFNGDPTVVVTQVAKQGPADGKLKIGDQLVSINNISLENIDRGTVVSMLRESGHSISLVVRRRVLLPGRRLDHPLRVTLARKSRKEVFGLILGCKVYVRGVLPNSLADVEGNIKPGDAILEIQNLPVDNLSFNEINRHLEKCKDKLKLLINKRTKRLSEGNSPGRRLKIPNGKKAGLTALKLSTNGASVEPARDPIKSEGPRLISLKKECGRGITVVGGNKTGVFVGRVDPESVPHQLGLVEGDLILKVNDTELFGKTREEAVLLLLPAASSGDLLSLLVQYRGRDYEKLISESSSSPSGDLFYVRSNFSCEGSADQGELSVQKGDVFQVVDTIPEGVIGSWRAVKVTGSAAAARTDESGIGGGERSSRRRGIIPNMNRAQQMALSSLLHKDTTNQSKKSGVNLFKRRPKSGIVLGSLSPQAPDSILQPPYDRVSFRNVTQRRPVVLCGVLSDAVAKMLIAERPEKFEVPEVTEGDSPFIRYSDVMAVIAKGKFPLLGLDCVERLRKTDLPPIVVCLRADSKQTIREVLQSWDKNSRHNSSPVAWKSPKKIFEQFQDFEKQHGHLFSCIVSLNSSETWMKELEDKVNELQREKVWMNDVTDVVAEDEIVHVTSQEFPSSVTNGKANDETPAVATAVDDRSRGNLARSSSDPNLLKPSGQAIRYLPSYSTATSLKARKRASAQTKNPPERVEGEEGRVRPRDRGPDWARRSSEDKGVVAPNYQPRLSSQINQINQQFKQEQQQQQKQRQQIVNGDHKRQPSNSFYPIFSSHGSSSNQDGLQNQQANRSGPSSSSPEAYAPVFTPPVHPPQHSRQQSADQKYGSRFNNNIMENNEDHRQSANKAGNPRVPRKSWLEEKPLVMPGELSLTGKTEIPIGPPDANRSHHEPKVQAPPAHQRFSSTSSSSSSVLKQQNGTIHRPLAPSNTSQLSGQGFNDASRKLQHLKEPRPGFGNNNNNVIAQARGTFDSSGGILDSKESGVKIIIPKGALPQGVDQEIYFKVCKDTNNITPLDKSKGEALLTPLVMCGPRGLQFLRPVELHIPPTTSVDPETWSFSVKSTDSPNGDPNNWHQMQLEFNNKNKNNDLLTRSQNTISFLVEKF